MTNQFPWEMCVEIALIWGTWFCGLGRYWQSRWEIVLFVSRLLVTYCSSWKLVQCWGQQEFAIPDNVLGIVYGQTICWIGAFFSPLLPAIATLKLIIIFYVKEVRRRLGRGLIFWTILDLARHSALMWLEPIHVPSDVSKLHSLFDTYFYSGKKDFEWISTFL